MNIDLQAETPESRRRTEVYEAGRRKICGCRRESHFGCQCRSRGGHKEQFSAQRPVFQIRSRTVFRAAAEREKEDLKPLTEHFISYYNSRMNRQVMGVDEDVRRVFENYPWPGNVRRNSAMLWSRLSTWRRENTSL